MGACSGPNPSPSEDREIRNQFDDVTQLLVEHGAKEYRSEIYTADGRALPSGNHRGLVIMRSARFLEPLGEDFYDDGLGNMLYINEFGGTGEDEPSDPDDSGSAGQPGPECTVEGDCPVYDPRCEPADTEVEHLWDCMDKTDYSMVECLKRINDNLYAATGGQCETILGPDDEPTMSCQDDSLGACVAAGGSLEECAREHSGDDGTDPSGEGDEFVLGSRPRPAAGTVSVLEVTPLGSVFLALCREGAEAFCQGMPGGGAPEF